MLATVLYAVGIVELELESTSALILLLFVIPLAFTLSGFLLWIMYALNGRSVNLAMNCFELIGDTGIRRNYPTTCSSQTTLQAVDV